MTPEFRQRIEEILDTTEDELIATVQHYQSEHQNLSQTDNTEVGDQAAVAESLNEMNMVLRHYEKRLMRIQNARKRLDMGHYGRCAQCGQSIGEERLTARPDALFCYDCMRERERRNQRQRTPA